MKALGLAVVFALILVLHLPLLDLPYFWDEVGHYVPAARDLLLTGDPIPRSTPSNAHPPLVLATLALAWRLAGYDPAVTRTTMLLFTALALCGVFRLGRLAGGRPVAWAATATTSLYPVFFAQSTLAHLDMAAAAFTLWGLAFYLEGRDAAATAAFGLAGLAKETAIVAPLALCAWARLEGIRPCRAHPQARGASSISPAAFHPRLTLLLSLLPLGLWLAYHYARTGFVFGNPRFFQENVTQTLHPSRLLIALGLRVWQTAGHMNLFVLTGATAFVLLARRPREPLAFRAPRGPAGAFGAVILAYVLLLSVIGGALHSRYLLPVVPLVIVLCVATLRRRLRQWPAALGLTCGAFVAGLLVNPPYASALEDNLAYRDFALLHQEAAAFLSERHRKARVLTAWPVTDELTRPELGYVTAALAVVPLEDFSADRLRKRTQEGAYDVLYLFSRKYRPRPDLAALFAILRPTYRRFFPPDPTPGPEEAMAATGGRLIFEARRGGLWVAILAVGAGAADVRSPSKETPPGWETTGHYARGDSYPTAAGKKPFSCSIRTAASSAVGTRSRP